VISGEIIFSWFVVLGAWGDGGEGRLKTLGRLVLVFLSRGGAETRRLTTLVLTTKQAKGTKKGLECGDLAPLWLPRPGSALVAQMGTERENKDFFGIAVRRVARNRAARARRSPDLGYRFWRRVTP